ncbi:MAG: carbamoyltransferase HypF [Anaerolineaceae bacterium]|nr:carbamoyltransferase HypF [Anaerolineaceae bacterium]
MSVEIFGYKILARGIVQGVGFRPFIYTQAIANHLTGWVRNTSNGVEVEINGKQNDLQNFLKALRESLPPLARIDQIEVTPTPPNGYLSFEITPSQPQPGEFLPVSPDISICADCSRELFNPTDRRYRYPFINCTNCGPRFSIVKDIPYDRPFTTMSKVVMCTKCQMEYDSPLDRRFHAQPIACPECGPQIWFEAPSITTPSRQEAALQTARQWLQDGKILAVKGLGGFHLVCDAANASAVEELRERKQRVDKPFALMAFDLKTVQHHCQVSEQEAELLLSHQHPIVLLDRKDSSNTAQAVAPNQQTLGVMLAYTPLHLLLLEPASGFPDLLVMTSANLSEEPICYLDQEAKARLAPLADGFLFHNRDIHMRVDDSVYREACGQPYPLRRARGYAPDGLPLPFSLPPLLAGGAEMKNTFCLTRQNYAFVSHHIGDMENFETLKSFEEGIRHYERLFRIHPEFYACDLHPDYLATKYIQQRACMENRPVFSIQHHHAHLAACMADQGWSEDSPVIGVCFDGTGLGTDGAIWGGEFLLGGYHGYQREYHLAYTPLPGGDAAVRKPARMALAYLWQAGLEWESSLPSVRALSVEERTAVRVQLEKSVNAPPTSSMGRFFDAAAALIGLREHVTYEGQAAIELENAADPDETGCYPFELAEDTIDPTPLWKKLLKDWHNGIASPILAARFHNSVANLTLEACSKIRQKTGSNAVALSGGVWQNRYLLERSVRLLKNANFNVLLHHQTPTNDGSISLGQAMVAAANIK